MAERKGSRRFSDKLIRFIAGLLFLAYVMTINPQSIQWCLSIAERIFGVPSLGGR